HCNITGILEVLPVAEAIRTLKSYYPTMKKLLVLNENTTTSRKTKPLLDTLLSRIGITVRQELVDDFEGWKSVFIDGNETCDVIYLQTRGAIKNWDHDEALRVIDRHIKVPLVTCEDFMMPYAVFGLTQVSKEQGMWAAETAKRILRGTYPEDIPIAKNQMSTVWINTRLAGKIHFVPDEALLSQARIVD
ncbi:MAG TPA: ABC transporter substrate binding protein, partial [bacterium]|nr:ABC transporter substrate binding protein [bacterium]